MRVLLTGSSGFIGSALVRALAERGDAVVPLKRGDAMAGAVSVDPSFSRLDFSGLPAGRLEGVDACIHLAGSPILGRWTARRREEIRSSRIALGHLLASEVAAMDTPPSVYLTSSAVGFYGDRGEELLDESSSPGIGFLAGVCRAWEEAAQPAREAGIRTAALRTGIVLGRDGGSLGVQAAVFRAGLGGRLGSGRQWVSWILLDDAIRAILHVLDVTTISGAVNLVSPDPVRNEELTAALAGALRRPALVPVPPRMLRLALGNGPADEMLLASQHVVPRRLRECGFDFSQPTLAGALSAALG